MRHWLTRPLTGVFFMSVFLLADTAVAQGQGHACTPHKDAVERLKALFGETPVFRGLTTTKRMLEVFVNLDTGSFTVLRTDATGKACFASSGEAARLVDELGEEEPNA